MTVGKELALADFLLEGPMILIMQWLRQAGVLVTLVLASLAVTICGPRGGALAQSRNTITMYPSQSAGSVRPQIDGGTKQDPVVWPATLKYYLNGFFACTSTIVGERVVITAAHCLDENAATQIRFDDQNVVNLSCNHHPRYQPSYLFADVALCFSASPIPAAKFAFENLDLRVTTVRMGTSLFLLGFGCRDVLDVDNPAKSGQLYGGSAKVFKLPTRDEDHISTNDGVVICPGDSGGAGYILAAQGEPGGPRSIIGINSGYYAQARVSAITPLTGLVAAFISDWSTDNKATICGVHGPASNCRDRFVPQGGSR
jgi:hypothetical protein